MNIRSNVRRRLVAVVNVVAQRDGPARPSRRLTEGDRLVGVSYTQQSREYSDHPALSVRTIKPKTAKTKITKLGIARIVHHDTLPTNEY